MTDGTYAINLSISALHQAYADGSLTPAQVMQSVLARIEATQNYNAWISVLSAAEITSYIDRLPAFDLTSQPLWGIPFAIKDNIDLAGIATTAACREFAYTPDKSAHVVQRLLDAGAIPVGKTNLDQFATGLVGVRTPYGAIHNALNPDYIAGGSSGGSAVAVRLGLCSFALGTDTAGSGRVPAALQGLVGMKPTRGWWSSRGVVPACRTLDCVSVFTHSVQDADAVAKIAGGFDTLDPYSRDVEFSGFDDVNPRYGILNREHLIDCDPAYKNTYAEYVNLLENATVIDPSPLFEAARLLYQGPWIAERYAAIESFLQDNHHCLHPTTAEIILGGASPTAVDAFNAEYRLAQLQRDTQHLFRDIDVLVLPTIPTHYTIEAVELDPIATNSRLGVYTNFVNLLDLCALAIPAGNLTNGTPFGVTLMAPAGRDYALLDLAARFEQPDEENEPVVSSLPRCRPGEFFLAVCGAHLSGQPLNHQLTERGGYCVYRGATSKNYQLYALPDGKRPALIRDETCNSAIELEVWAIPERTVGSFMRGVAPPLGIGSVELADGLWVNGFIAEPTAVQGAKNISSFGSWIAYQHPMSAPT